MILIATLILAISSTVASAQSDSPDLDLMLFTVATEQTDGFQRYIRSVQVYQLPGKVIAMGESWKGGDIEHQPGGGFKINQFKQELQPFKDQDNLVVLFSDSYDVILLADKATILSKFAKTEANVVFGAEDFCWPDAKLADQYPATDQGYRFLNSGAFIGYAKDVWAILNSSIVEDTDDDQLFYTRVFLDEELRTKHRIRLDHKAQLFQNLNGAVADVEIKFRDNEAYLENTIYTSEPVLIHGNGPSKRVLNSLGNYLAKAWHSVEQCLSCWEDTLHFQELSEVPQLVLAIFIERPYPFLEEFFDLVAKLEYPKDKVDVFIHCAVAFHDKDVDRFVSLMTDQSPPYHSVKVVKSEEKMSEWQARDAGLELCVSTKCDFYFSLDGEAHIDNPHTVELLIEQNRNVVAPLLARPFKAWSNFWGALNQEEFYARSVDYMEIVHQRRRGLWNVPFISSAYLIKGPFIQKEATRPSFVHKMLDADMAFCKNLRDRGNFFYVSNRVDFGHLVNTDSFSTEHLHNELWEIENNRYDWEKRYLHPNYSQNLEENAVIANPCPDVYWFPIVTERFADELVAEMEHYGKWSDGSNKDTRLEGGYENVPTRDIHMNQVGYEAQWLLFLDAFVRPMQEKIFTGYSHVPPRAIMNFVVRYRPDEQPFLRPHHDASTYTINLALNHAGVDYEGGGCHYLRYNCTVKDTKKGWMLMHPGRLTHYHEGLTVTKGTRYIMVSFVDP